MEFRSRFFQKLRVPSSSRGFQGDLTSYGVWDVLSIFENQATYLGS